jgi:hypothetical protein
MATWSTLSDIVNAPVFQNRVHMAMQEAAWSVYSEDVSTVGHAERAAYANKVANGTFALSEVCYLVLTNPSVGAEADPLQPPDYGIPDADIQFAVNSYWNLLAGV